MSSRVAALAVVGAVVATTLTTGLPAGASAEDVTVQTADARPKVRPGPDILYARAHSPQLSNAAPWRAEPILVSGASAYRDGEFLYQDFLYDDQGAGTTPSYPADPAYAGNAADVVELRVKPRSGSTAVRITYNSMIDPELVATTVALGESAAPVAMPHGANTVAPAEVFVTVHGDTAVAVDAAGTTLEGTLGVDVSLERRQVDVRIPTAIFDPGRDTVRIAAATGLWDAATGAYRTRDATTSAFFNVGFRYTESGGWNSTGQAAALTARDISRFHALVDFAKLRDGTDDELTGTPEGVPQVGYQQRIVVSHFETQQGRGVPSGVCEQPCQKVPELAGRLQPYSLYVPTTAPPAAGFGLVYRPHSCGSTYMSNVGTPERTDLIGEQIGAIVFVPAGRGTCQWYWGQSGADVFEVAGDIMRRYDLDPSYTSVTGFSMGGYGAYKLAAQWPDLFARAATQIACTSAEVRWPGPGTPPTSGESAVMHHLAASWRNVPILSMNGNADTTCVTTSQRTLRETVDALGYRYEWREYTGDHIPALQQMAALDPAAIANFLDQRRVDPDPAHVTYVYSLEASETQYGLNADHAYWVSGLSLRSEDGDSPRGTVDVFSHGFGRSDLSVRSTQAITGNGYTGFRKEWGQATIRPAADVLDIKATNVDAVTIDVRRARVSCDATLNVVSEGPVTVTLAGCRG